MLWKFKISSLLIFFLSLQFSYAQKSLEDQVKETFENYKSAILNDEGEKAVEYVSSKTIQYYSNVLELVKTADSAEVEALSILDKLMVFSIRHRTSVEEILSFNGRTLLIYAIKKGMVGKGSVANITTGEVIMEDGYVKSRFIANGQETPIFFHFYKEEDKWKLDLTSVFPTSEMAMNKLADDSGTSTNEYLFFLLEMLTKEAPGPEIWVPTAKRAQ